MKVRPLFLVFMKKLTLYKKALKDVKARQALEVFKIIHNLITD